MPAVVWQDLLVNTLPTHMINGFYYCLVVVGRALRAAGGAKLEKECNTVSSQTNMSVTEGNLVSVCTQFM